MAFQTRTFRFLLFLALVWLPVATSQADDGELQDLLRDGWTALDNGQLTLPPDVSAAARIEQVLALDPNNEEAQRGLIAVATALKVRGMDAHNDGYMRKAVSFYRQSVALDPRNARVLALLGEAYLGMNEEPRALEAFGRAIDIDPENADFLSSYGSAAYRMSDYATAAEAYRRALAIDADNHSLHRTLATTYEKMDQWADAAASHLRAFEIEPRPEVDNLAIGGNYLRAGQFGDAIPFLASAAAYTPDDPAIWDDLATAYHRERRLEEASVAAAKRDKLRAGSDVVTTASITPPPDPAEDGLGHAAYERGDWAVAASKLVGEAERGDANAAYRLARLYHEGLGVPADAYQANEWYAKAAAAGHPGGQAGLGYMAYRGEGGATRDLAQAAEWFLKAANGGVHGAMARLGHMYEHGEGVAADSTAAIDWYFKAAGAGNMDARTRLTELGVSADNAVMTATPNTPEGIGELPDLLWQAPGAGGPLPMMHTDTVVAAPAPPASVED